MNDFFDGFWGYYIATVVLGGIVWCLWLLYSQRKWLVKKTPGVVEDTGHVWDGDLRELNNPVPRWWTYMYVIMCLFGVGYLVLYPGLGAYQGSLGYTSATEVQADQAQLNEEVKPVYARFASMDIPAIAADPDARVIGQRLFLNNCAQCHGSDARGAISFPNLVQGDSMYGRTPEAIQTSITKGRNGIMPPMSATINPKVAGEIAQYVRSMSGLAHDQIRVIAGKREYMNNCVACHGVDGKGNKALGAPNLTDDVWLYGSSEASIVHTILNGRNNRMPAQEHLLTPEQIRLLTAWVWGLSGGKDVTTSAAMSSSPAK
ncbi:cytochrome-c oxidase, cbb3-type subunit III [Zwartia vadi]|uniref:cytochrome-c oxidase, cbb3-type subunit III n=1 Tax=Zwartia vadi TaxID=3058168 RepID=UPI0025B543BB|nr:cytochrome-c oxidase, cbb3-type subunit III [Zwartia vadi]MDN3988378.1 cytochrome-c oxidase, cbb3-type subunit III [Zwartia vadi]